MCHLCTHFLLSNGFMHICVPITTFYTILVKYFLKKYGIIPSALWWASLELIRVRTVNQTYQMFIILP